MLFLLYTIFLAFAVIPSVLSMPTHWTYLSPRTVCIVHLAYLDGFFDCSPAAKGNLQLVGIYPSLCLLVRNVSYKPSSATHSAFNKDDIEWLSFAAFLAHQLRPERCAVLIQTIVSVFKLLLKYSYNGAS